MVDKKMAKSGERSIPNMDGNVEGVSPLISESRQGFSPVVRKRISLSNLVKKYQILKSKCMPKGTYIESTKDQKKQKTRIPQK